MASPQNTLTLFLLLPLLTTITVATLPVKPTTQLNSNSILIALLDSRYTEVSELVEKALLLQTLEQAVTIHNITIFAPTNEALEHDLDPTFKHFLLEPRNLRSLQSLLLHHIVPTRVGVSLWPNENTIHNTLSDDPLHLSGSETVKFVNSAEVVVANDVVRNDGIIHGIGRILIPKSVQQEFNKRRSLRVISAVLPIYSAMAPGPSLAPAPAPGPGGPHHHFDGESQVKDFIHTLLQYGGYNEMADILVNLTNLATEMGKLVSEGYVLTVLAPNDEAMAKLTTDQLAEPGAPEKIMYYHIVPEYQTEESMYNAVRRFGKIQYDTLHMPHKVVAQEADGSVKFGDGEDTAYLFDPDIYIDGRISVQGIDGVLFPSSSVDKNSKATENAKTVDSVPKPRRGKLREVACGVLASIGQDATFTACHHI
ncbi:putative FAS1 domain-containing protein [Helianthus annuus]|nr:putative FAS1 domain-containing protein [Helianthus annuus]